MASAKIKGIGGGPYDPRKLIGGVILGAVVLVLVLSVIFDWLYVRAALGLPTATPLSWSQEASAPPNKAPSNPAPAAPKQTARQEATPAQRPAATSRATATRQASARTVEQPAAGPLTRDEVNRLVTLLQNTYRVPAGHGVDGILLGREDGTKYHVYFNGTNMGPDRAVSIQLLPTEPTAHFPTSQASRNAFVVWDWGLDGTVNRGQRGSPYAPMPQEELYLFQSGIPGGQDLGLDHRVAYQQLFANAVRDILARRR